MSTMGPIYQPGEEHEYAEPPERQRTDDDMVTMVGPDGSKREVSREAAQHTELGLGLGFADVVDRMLPHQLRAELRAMADRVDAAYEQGKEVGRVNGSARLAEAREKIAELIGTVTLVREQRDALEHADPDFPSPKPPCGDGRCYCGGCVL